MNIMPEEFVRVMPDAMRAFIAEMFGRVGMSGDRAALMADLLVATDMRGVFSHGTRQSIGYLRLLKNGSLNPNPEVRAVQETPATAALDGDGGLGHFAAWRAAHLAVEKAGAVGLAAVATRNHHHFGGAGKYSRVMSGAGFVGFVVSSHVRRLSPESGIMSAGGASPMSFAVPSGEGPPLVLDMATSFGQARDAGFEEIFRQLAVLPVSLFGRNTCENGKHLRGPEVFLF